MNSVTTESSTLNAIEILKKKLVALKAEGTNLSIEDLAQVLFNNSLEEISKEFGIRDDPRGLQVTQATQILKAYLILADPECDRVVKLRSRGWHDNKEEGDAHFQNQRQRADSTTPEEERNFFIMMRQIGDEMQLAHRIFSIPYVPYNQVNVLDLCMAPGGYTAAALDYCNGYNAYGITLAAESGGHTVIIDRNRLHGLRFHDITMFKELCPSEKEIPGALKSKFSDIKPFGLIRFHLVFADGKTLRTHDRLKDTYDANQNKETVRLQTSQLILAMNRMHNGGTLVMLLHKIDTWNSAFLLCIFSKFSEVKVFKPIRKHAARSSFYLVAKDINVNHAEAAKAVRQWKEDWYRATFEGPDGAGLPKEEPSDDVVQDLLTEFGPTLVELGHHAWMIQANALSKTSYAGRKVDGEKLGLRKRVWGGVKDLFKDHHGGLRMERGKGYAPIGGRGAGGWVAASDGQITAPKDETKPITSTTGDNRAVFMMG